MSGLTQTDPPVAGVYVFPPFMQPGQVFENSVGKRFKLVRTKQVNWLAEDESGEVWNIRQTPRVKLLEPEDFKGVEREAATLHLGTTVAWVKDSPNARKYPHIYVVIKLGDGVVNIAQLNGKSNQYFRSVLPTDVVEVQVEEI